MAVFDSLPRRGHRKFIGVPLRENLALRASRTARPETVMATLTVKKKMLAVGRDYAVHDENDATVFTIDGKLRFARTFDVKDRTGQVVCSAKEKLLALDQTFLIDTPGASEITVRRTTTGSVNPMKFDISVGDEIRMQAHGSFLRDGIDITRGSTRIGNVSRQQNTVVAEIFHVWMADGEDAALMLAMAMVIIEGDLSRGAQTSSTTP
jgi:uncharacterized protein YxjI